MTTDAPLLTTRETEVLRLVVAGFSTAQIAGELLITVNTVESHRKHLYHKMGVRRVGEAIRVARELELLGR